MSAFSAAGEAQSTANTAEGNAKKTAQTKGSPGANLPSQGISQPLQVELVPKETFLDKQAIALFAAAVSLVALGYTIYVNLRTRQRSVADEFWFRQVTYPLFLEPTVNFFGDCVRDLPADTADPRCTSQVVNDFRIDFEKRIEQFADLLPLFASTMEDSSTTLYVPMRGALEALEDTVVNYCASNQGGFRSGKRATYSRERAIEEIRKQLVDLLKPIRLWQRRM